MNSIALAPRATFWSALKMEIDLWQASAGAAVTAIAGGVSAWMVARVKARAELTTARITAEPAVTAAVNAAIEQIVSMQSASIARLSTQLDMQGVRMEQQAQRLERQSQNIQIMRDRLDRQNEYIVDLTALVSKAGLDVPPRPNFMDLDFHIIDAINNKDKSKG